MTLNELVELYASLIEKENEDFKRRASLEGIDLYKETSQNQDAEMAQRFREHVAKKKGTTAAPDLPPGTGYIQL